MANIELNQPTGNLSPNYKKLITHLNKVRQQWIFVKLLEGFGLLLIVLASLVLINFSLDNVLAFSWRTIFALQALMVVAATTILGMFVAKPLIKKKSDDYFAIHADRASSNLRNRLINCLQLSREKVPSPAILTAVVDDTAAMVDELDVRKVFEKRRAKRFWIVVLVLGLVLAGYAGIFFNYFSNAAKRFFIPMSGVDAIAAPSIKVTPGDCVVLKGESVKIEAVFQGKPRSAPAVRYRIGKDGKWQKEQLDEKFTHIFKTLNELVEYRVMAGRSRAPDSGSYHIRVTESPAVENIKLDYEYPKYTQLPAKTLERTDGNISAPIGSKVNITVYPNKPIAEAVLSLGGETEGKVDISQEGALLAELEVQRTSFYQIKMKDMDGYENPAPIKRSIRAIKDNPPEIGFVQPGADVTLNPNSSLQLLIEARDDYGVADIALFYGVRPVDGREARRWNYEKPKRNTSESHLWAFSTLRLKEGDVVTYYAKAVDTGGLSSQSEKFSVKIVSPETEKRRMLREELDQLKQLYEIIALQKRNKADTDSRKPARQLIEREIFIRSMTGDLSTQMKQATRPLTTIITTLDGLIAKEMSEAIALLEKLERSERPLSRSRSPSRRSDMVGNLPDKSLRKTVSAVQAKIIAILESLIKRLEERQNIAKTADEAANKTSKEEREKAIKMLQEMIGRLNEYIEAQKRIIPETNELPRKPEDFAKDDVAKSEKLAEEEDKWAKMLTEGVDEIKLLAEQSFANPTLVSDYKEIIEHTERAADALEQKDIHMAVPLEQLGRELAEELVEDLEMWLPDVPDYIKWDLEQPPDMPDIPMAELPDELSDLIGDLLASEEELTEEVEDITSSWADSISAAGWTVMDGPISNFSAKGKTGNTLPNDIELNGRSGDGRAGKSSGELVENVAKGLDGRTIPTRLTNDPFEKGYVEELRAQKTGGSTGGGKRSGAGAEGLSGRYPPKLIDEMNRLANMQSGIREKAERVQKSLQAIGIAKRDFSEGVRLMKEVEDDMRDYRYAGITKKQRMVIRSLRRTNDEFSKDMIVWVNKAVHLPKELRDKLLDAMDESYPPEYEQPLRAYYRALSEAE